MEINHDLDTLIKENNIERALDLCAQKEYLDDPDVQLKRIRLMRNNRKRWKDILKISTRTIFLKNADIQYERMLVLLESGNGKGTIDICKNFMNEARFKVKMIKAYLMLHEYYLAYNLCLSEDLKNNEEIKRKAEAIKNTIEQRKHDIHKYDGENPLMIYQKANFLRTLGMFDETIKLCDENLNDINFVVLKINALIQMNNFKEAFTFSENYRGNCEVQRVIIEYMCENKMYEEALKIMEREELEIDGWIQAKRIKLLVELDRKKEAYELYKAFAYKLKGFSLERDFVDNFASLEEVPKEGKNVLITRIYADKFRLDMLDDATINDFEKIILTIAYYDKYSKKQGIYYVKQIFATKKLSPNEKSIINSLYENLISKRNTIFDIQKYTRVINAEVLFSIMDNLEYEEKKVEVYKPVIKETKFVVEQKQKEKPKYIEFVGKKFERKENEPNKTISKPKKEGKEKVLIKKILEDQVEEINLSIVKQFGNEEHSRNEIIKAMDIFDDMVHKVANINNSKRVINFIYRISALLELDISDNEMRELFGNVIIGEIYKDEISYARIILNSKLEEYIKDKKKRKYVDSLKRGISILDTISSTKVNYKDIKRLLALFENIEKNYNKTIIKAKTKTLKR